VRPCGFKYVGDERTINSTGCEAKNKKIKNTVPTEFKTEEKDSNQHNRSIVDQSRSKSRESCHGAMHSILRQNDAVHLVGRIR
jgi:hypothetical protein